MRTIREVMDSDPCTVLELGVRCSNCLKNMQIRTMEGLTKQSLDRIAKARNVGKKSIEELTGKMSDLDLTFGMTDRDWVKWGYGHIEWIKRH